jgi:uncharacterized membrane protein
MTPSLRYSSLLLPAGFNATALNDSGVIVGTFGAYAARFQKSQLQRLPGQVRHKNKTLSQDKALGISRDGRIVGAITWHFGEPGQEPAEGTIWQGRHRQAVLPVPGYSHGELQGINARGEVVGSARTASVFEATATSNNQSKALYGKGTTVTVVGLGALHAINDAGATVGSLGNDAVFRASATIAWQRLCKGAATNISPSGLVCGDQNLGDSHQIQSQVVSGGKTQETTYFPLCQAFLWQKEQLTALPPLPGHEHSHALGVNDSGMVVGYSVDADNHDTATLWLQGQAHDLNRIAPVLSLRLTRVVAITTKGQLLCDAENAKHAVRSVLLTPK